MGVRYFDYNPNSAIIQSAGALGEGIKNAGLGLYKYNQDKMDNDLKSKEYNEKVRQYDIIFGENSRQFGLNYGLNKQRVNNDTITTTANAGLTTANTGKVKQEIDEYQYVDADGKQMIGSRSGKFKPIQLTQPPQTKEEPLIITKDGNGNPIAVNKYTGQGAYIVNNPNNGKGGMMGQKQLPINQAISIAQKDKYWNNLSPAQQAQYVQNIQNGTYTPAVQKGEEGGWFSGDTRTYELGNQPTQSNPKEETPEQILKKYGY